MLQTYYAFPSENWWHIRTTNPIASTFATIRLRHRKKRNNGSAKATFAILLKLAKSAPRGWRKLRGHQQISELIRGIRFIDGLNEQSLKEQSSAVSQLPTTYTEIVA